MKTKPVLLCLCLIFILFSFRVQAQFAYLVDLNHACIGSYGSVEYALNGGPDSYTYYWKDGPVTLARDSLNSGSYTLVVEDFFGCVEEYTITIFDVDGCTIQGQLVYAPDPCYAVITNTAYSGSNELIEASINIEWDDGYTGGLNRTIPVWESGTYCVTITIPNSNGGNCCFSQACYTVVDNEACDPSEDEGKVIVNEFNRAEDGSDQYVELLVIGNGSCSDSFDLRGYLLDDNNGHINPVNAYINAFNFPLTGIDPGFLGFSYHNVWKAVPNGSLIVIYDPASPYSGLPPDDPMDANQDKVYVLSALDTTLFARSGIWDNGQLQYQGVLQATTWDYVKISEEADGMQVRHADGTYSHGVSMGQSAYSVNNTFNLWITESVSKDANCQLILSDYLDKTHFDCPKSIDSLQSPGLANSVFNAALIDSLRNCNGANSSESNTLTIPGGFENNLENSSLEDQINAYPNPFYDRVQLEFYSIVEGPALIQIFTSTGQLLRSQAIKLVKAENRLALDELTDLPTGILTIQCTFPSGVSKQVRIAHLY